MDKLLQGKTIVITGASRGIGKAIAAVCAREGANVGINYLTNAAQARALADELQRTYRVSAYPLGFDVRRPESIAQACEPLLRNTAVDGWVNNAAINLQGLLLSQTEQDILEQISTNIAGPIHCCRFILKPMLERKCGVIVNIGSVASTHVGPGQCVYAATKGALASLTRALAYEYGRKRIRVNCIEPGPVETDMFRKSEQLAGDAIRDRIPLRRFGSPEEIAEFCAFLLSDRASFITGGIFTADGGYSLG